ncbi:MAG: hypothetical protein H0T76_05085 [Nannocystis sp.]|nr:hypothetical protein [Nannocystis sp.]MBA3545839.1 hypothetical protein [Nannocystis sp.]
MRSQVCVVSWLSLGMFGLACDPANDDPGAGEADEAVISEDDRDDDVQDEDESAPVINPKLRPLATPDYRAYGPQRDVPVADLAGWTPCFTETYGPTRTAIFTILQACDKPNLMLACRPTGDDTFTVLAHAPRGAVLTDTGHSNAPTISNGTGWYFNEEWSWGFAAAGDPIDRNECDDNTETNSELRMCIPTANASTGLGFRCGDNFVYQDTWERVILQAD